MDYIANLIKKMICNICIFLKDSPVQLMQVVEERVADIRGLDREGGSGDWILPIRLKGD